MLDEDALAAYWSSRNHVDIRMRDSLGKSHRIWG